MSDRLTFHQEGGRLVIKFDGKPIPEEKHEALFVLLQKDMEQRVRDLWSMNPPTP